MLGTGPHIAASTVARTCQELDVRPPAKYLERLAEAEALRTNLAKFSNRNTGSDLFDAVFASISDGVHPADSEDVRRLLVAQQLQNMELHRQADERSKALTGDAVCQFADTFITLWAKATLEDGKTLWETAQHPVFADVPDIADMHPSQLIDSEAHQRWISSATALRRLSAGAAGFTALLSATRLTFPPGHWPLVIAPTLELDDLTELNRSAEHGRRPSAWDVARAGHVPALAGSLGDFAAASGGMSAQQSVRAQATTATTITAFR